MIGDRRPGDLPDSWADASKAAKVLGWEAKNLKICVKTVGTGRAIILTDTDSRIYSGVI